MRKLWIQDAGLPATTCKSPGKREQRRVERSTSSPLEEPLRIPLDIREDNRVYLPVYVSDVRFSGLLDSGATRSCIGSRGWKKLQDLGYTVKRYNRKFARVANGQMCEILGIVTLTVRVDTISRVFAMPLFSPKNCPYLNFEGGNGFLDPKTIRIEQFSTNLDRG